MKFYNKIDSNKTNKTSPKHFQGFFLQNRGRDFASPFPYHLAQCLAHSECSAPALVLFLKRALGLYLSTSMEVTTSDEVMDANIQRNTIRGCKVL